MLVRCVFQAHPCIRWDGDTCVCAVTCALWESEDDVPISGRTGEGTMARGTGPAPRLSLWPPAGRRQGAGPKPTWGRFLPRFQPLLHSEFLKTEHRRRQGRGSIKVNQLQGLPLKLGRQPLWPGLSDAAAAETLPWKLFSAMGPDEGGLRFASRGRNRLSMDRPEPELHRSRGALGYRLLAPGTPGSQEPHTDISMSKLQ